MLYYLSLYLTPHMGAFNVFSYHTVRAGGALVTGFLLSLVVGPRIIEGLKRLKVGQYIKKDHVVDLHALHKDKAGTPTMGGALIIVATLLSLLLWSTLTNRLLIVAVLVLCGMGAVGFIDDFIKLRRKTNDGLSAKAKLVGQIVVGGLLGIYVVMCPVTYGASYLRTTDDVDWNALGAALSRAFNDAPGDTNARLKPYAANLPPELIKSLGESPVSPATRSLLVDALNKVFDSPGIFRADAWAGVELDNETRALTNQEPARLDSRERVRLNRLLFEVAAEGLIVQSPRNLHTKVAIPGIKDWFIPFGLFYAFFVIVIITSTSNAVNLSDGLDGLAAGASVISIFAFTTIAYVVSRADWSGYLLVTHIPEASELTVFGSALLGTGLGFLWFNAHPAEVFMGDTGSLSLGGVMGAMAVLTKQELLLPIVGGIFVLEALSVIVQVASFKLRGKRVFRMAPLHHHFELMGWSESKVTIRFWILAFVFALMRLVTLKLR
jgi:phospho-N-acetylmuramoyl-pentapeptide-transferase